MSSEKFMPDEKAVARMTPYSIGVLLTSLKEQRAVAVKPFNERIDYYEKLLATKREEEEQRNQATLPGVKDA